MRNAVLRAREVYADVRASVWDGQAGALGRMLEALPHHKQSRWLGPWQVHPDPAVRRQTLDDTSPLFRLRFWDALAAGLAASIAYPNIFGWLLGVTSGANQFVLAPLLTVLILASLLTGVVGAGAWRATLAAL